MKKFLRGVLVLIGIVFCVALAFALHELDFWNWPVVKPTLGEYREHVVVPWREWVIGLLASEARSLKDGMALLFGIALPWIGLLLGIGLALAVAQLLFYGILVALVRLLLKVLHWIRG